MKKTSIKNYYPVIKKFSFSIQKNEIHKKREIKYFYNQRIYKPISKMTIQDVKGY